MNVRCIFCGTSLTVDDSVVATDTPVSCPSCKGSFVVGKEGQQAPGIAPLIPEAGEPGKSTSVPGLTNFYIPAGLGVLSLAGLVFLVLSVVKWIQGPSLPPAPVPRERKLPGKPVADESFGKGVTFYKNKNYTAAVLELQRSLRNNPDNIAAYVYLGGSYVHLKKYKEAIPYLDKGKSYPLYQKFVYQNLGISWERMARYKEAVSAYYSLTEVDPKSSFAYARLGYCYSQLRDYKKAEKALQDAVKLNPKDQWAKTQLAYVKKRLKK